MKAPLWANPYADDAEPLAPDSAQQNLSVLKAVALIGCFVGDSPGATLSELARRTGMNVSTAYRMLRTLTHTGVLIRLPNEDRYVPGPMLMAMSCTLMSQEGYAREMGILQELATATGGRAGLGFRAGTCVAILFAAGTEDRARSGYRPGERLNLQCTALGKAILSAQPGPALQMARALGPLQPMTPHSLTEPEALAEAIETARTCGYALSRNETRIGMMDIAVPLPDSGSATGTRLALGVQFAAAAFDPRQEGAIAAALKEAAQQLAGRLDLLPF